MRTSSDHEGVRNAERWRVLFVLSMGLFMALLDVSIVTVALPSIQIGIGASEADIQWVVAGYALAFGVLQVPAGRMGNLFGSEGLFMIGMAGFTAASAWSGLANDPTVLNIARGAQGLGAGIMVPQIIALIQLFFRGPERGRAFGIFGGGVGVAVAIGPTLGGFLIHLFGVEHGWRAIFFINIPIGIAALVLAFVWFPKPLFKRDPDDGTSRDLDPVGALLLGVGVLGILLPFMEARNHALTWLALPIGVALLAAWVLWERHYRARGKSPMVDLRIFRVASFRNGSLLLGFFFFGTASVWVVLNLYFQQGLHHSALASGFVGLASAVMVGLVSVWAGKKVATYGRRLVVWGLCVALAGIGACVAVVALHAAGLVSEWWLVPALAIFGAGGGAVTNPNQTLTLEDVPLEYAGSSGGIMQTTQQIGTAIGLSVVTAVTFAALRMTHDWAAAFVASLGVIAVAIGAAQVMACMDLRRRRGQVP